jgi:two-component system chemotaxis response regulator CheB
VRALDRVVSSLPPGFPASVLVVLHRSADYPDRLAEVLSYRARLPVTQAQHGKRARAGTVYVAPAGRHLIVRPNGTFCTGRTERVRFVRPSADLLFESLAARDEDRAIAVVLTGKGADGSKGVRPIRARGGFVIAQDEASAEHFDMPRSTIETAQVDLVLPLSRIAFALTVLVMGQEAALAFYPDPGPVGRQLRAG